MEAHMPTTVRLRPEIEERLDAIAAETGRSKAHYLREFIEQGLEDLEDYRRAAAALERYRRGEEKTYSSAEVRKYLGLDD
jgi:RHH-type rel operon transcriptional repressor/antitoxin RelB